MSENNPLFGYLKLLLGVDKYQIPWLSQEEKSGIKATEQLKHLLYESQDNKQWADSSVGPG